MKWFLLPFDVSKIFEYRFSFLITTFSYCLKSVNFSNTLNETKWLTANAFWSSVQLYPYFLPTKTTYKILITTTPQNGATENV